MANALNEEIVSNVRELIARITGYELGSDEFRTVEKCVTTTLKKSDTMYFLNTKDIRQAIWSMAEKFSFHGFFKHAEYLKQTHDRYIDKNLSESELTPRLNVVKFLLCMSQSPTTHFWKYPEKFEFIQAGEEEQDVVDWGAYLNEGIERWSPVKEDSFELSDSEEEIGVKADQNQLDAFLWRRPVITESHNLEEYDFKACRTKLMETIQNDWYDGKAVCMKPPSEWYDANVGLLWEQHLQRQVHDLIQIEPITVISEYKVMREVLWQMWGPHSSTVFAFSTNKLVARPNVTIASMRTPQFEDLIGVFVDYIEILDEFRQFWGSLEDPDAGSVPETYRTYGQVQKKITKPVFDKLIEIENKVREQETTMTLLKLVATFERVFEPVRILKVIHRDAIKDFRQNSPLNCSLTLLTHLRKSLQFSLNKLEQDMRLTLYLECLYYYFTMVNSWLVKNDLSDYTKEFVILNKNQKSLQINLEASDMNFVLQDGSEEFRQTDAVIRLICEQVLEIGRNIHLLRLLGKYDVFARGSETIHQEFQRRFLEELRSFYGQDSEPPNDEPLKVQKVATSFDMNGMGDWTNFVDLSDGFLTKAFEGMYVEKVEEPPCPSLFDKISKITNSLFPLQELPEKIFGQILKERFTISGLMVKNLLIENYGLDKQFEFLNHIFLFDDDLIFPFYRRLFEKMTVENSNWGNSVWLTSHLQDVIMDMYPNFYEDCAVQVKDYWKQCRDSLEACALLSLHYEIKWPLNIIITKDHIAMYKDLFQFILKIKWALYTINHLSFTDLEPKKCKEQRSRIYRTTMKRLKYLRFNLINILNSIQHHLFGFLFKKYRIQFELDFEKSNDLKSLIRCHDDFIRSLHRTITEMRNKESNQHGFGTLLKCVKMLKVMWNDTQFADTENLENCYKTYKMSFSVINSIVNPVYMLDY